MVHAPVVYKLHLEVSFYDPLSSIVEVQKLLVKRLVFNSEIQRYHFFSVQLPKAGHLT